MQYPLSGSRVQRGHAAPGVFSTGFPKGTLGWLGTACWLAILPLAAAPVAYEGFGGAGYVVNAGLGGLNGGTGWSGAWTASATDKIGDGSVVYANGAAVLHTSGGKAQLVGGSGARSVATGPGSPAQLAGVVDGNGNIGANGTSVWVAFIGQCTASGSDFGISFGRPGAAYDQPQTGVISLGGERQWRFWPQANLTGIAAANQVLLVWRVDFTAASDSCSVWFNPKPGTVPTDGSRNLHSAGGDWSFNRISFSGGSATTLLLDEIRIGTSYADVVPIDASAPAVAGLPDPAALAANVGTSTALDWSECLGAEAYDVYLWPASGPQPVVATATVAASRYDPPGDLQPFTDYHWKIVATNSFGGTAGPVWSFTTGDGTPLPPASPAPAAAATAVLPDVVVDWADSPGAVTYQVYLWPANGSKPGTPTATVTASSHTPSQPLAGNTSYQWQIVAVNPYGSTPGPVWTFTTGDRYPGHLVPWPKTVTMGLGDFAVTGATRIVAEQADLLPLAQVMARDFLMATGLALTPMQGAGQAGDIVLRLDAALPVDTTLLTAPEAYQLDVTAANIILTGRSYQAVAWASVTLLQALDATGTPVTVPQMSIADQPKVPLRTVMWDIARFFHPLENLYELVDLHRMYKVSYMHLYMSADGLFTFGSTAFPQLAKTKNGSEAYAGSPGFYLPPNGARLYYTKAELTALVQYAKHRGIVIVPEIDTPSWAAYMTSTLPAVFSSEGGTTVTHDININYPIAVAAMDAIIGELAEVFTTSPYIHIGADEVPTAEFEGYPYYSTSKVANDYASGGEAMVWYMHHLDQTIKQHGKSSWAWSTPGVVGKGYDMPADFNSSTDKGLVYTAWGYDDGANASQGGYSVMRAAGGHVAGMGQANRHPPYNRCLLYRPAEGIYNRLTPLLRFISAPDNMYTDLQPSFLPLTGRENKIVGAHIMEWETPYEIEVPAFRLSMPALGEPTWNQESTPRRNWNNFLIRQAKTDRLYQRVMRPVNLSVTTQVDPKDICFTSGGMVTMSSPVAGTIRYTIGTDYKNSWYNFPTNSSTAYTGPFAIHQSSVISARLFDAAGNSLGNPVTRGFYLITPKVHYKYYYTGGTPVAGFEKSPAIVDSVMGQMDGNAPHEDVRFGDTLHRTIYTGSITTAAANYTFSPAYGGSISIDRVSVPNDTPVALTAGEHLMKIVTPASGLGTPYTFSGPGYGSGSDLNLLLKSLSTAAQVLPVSHGFGSVAVTAGASACKEITIINHSVTTPLVLSSVGLAGANAADFTISEDSGETTLGPGAERVVGLRFDPNSAGAKSATLHVVGTGLAGGVVDVTLTGTALAGTAPGTPAAPSPANAAADVATSASLDWADSTDAESYQVYLWQSSGTEPASASATVSASQWTPAALTASTAYNWRVVATNGVGSTPGPVWTFVTAAAPAPATPASPTPADGATGIAIGGTLDWADSANASGYAVYLWLTVNPEPGTASATVTASNWTPAAGLALGSNYSWKVVAINAATSTAGPVWTFTTAAQVPPTVSITSPSNNSTITVGTDVQIQAAADDDGSVTQVEFYADGTLLGNDTTAPYAYTWTNATQGPHVLTAVATDNEGLTTTSAGTDLTIAAPAPVGGSVISVDFVVGPGSGDGSGPCSGDTVATGTAMKNAVGNVFGGQAGAWNALNIGTYSYNSATTGFLLDGSGATTSVKLALGRATGVGNTLAGGWRCNPNEAAANSVKALRSESAYIYFPTLTADHFAWAITGLKAGTAYKLTFFGHDPASGTASNIAFAGTADAVPAVRDAEYDWNWTSVNADATGKISGTFSDTGNNRTVGLQGMQIQEIVPEVITAYQIWAGAAGLDNTNGKESVPEADPDRDGRSNRVEFALNGNPLSGGNDGKTIGKLATLADSSKVFTLTLPVRNGAVFSGPGDLVSAAVDGIVYRIQGSTDLEDFTSMNIIEVTGGDAIAIQAGLPTLTEGWSYRSFRVPGTVSGGTPRDFLRVSIEQP